MHKLMMVYEEIEDACGYYPCTDSGESVFARLNNAGVNVDMNRVITESIDEIRNDEGINREYRESVILELTNLKQCL